MKTKFVFGMVALAATLAFSTAHAVEDAARPKTAQEILVDYTQQVKKAEFGDAMTAKGLTTAKMDSAKSNMINQMGLSAADASKLSVAIGHKPERVDALATVVAAKLWATEVTKKNAAEGKSLSDAATASAKFLANSSLTGAFPDSKELSAAELNDTKLALTKLETLPESILTHFNKAERDSYAQILERHAEILDKEPNKLSEEAFVESIMSVKGVDKATAMDLVRKLKECV